VVALTSRLEEFWDDDALPVAVATKTVVVGGKMPEAVGEKVVLLVTMWTTEGIVAVDEAEAVAVDEMEEEAEAEAEAEAELDDEEVILNGNEYWKTEVSESFDSLNP